MGVDKTHAGKGRIIPASAGSTNIGISTTGCKEDHPRIRGEHVIKRSGEIYRKGSSPHPRGAPSRPGGLKCRPWIIPASAGSTSRLNRTSRLLEDHPRIRGEHLMKTDTPFFVRGSSPHPRGAPTAGTAGTPQSRIIPASAGSTRPCPRIAGNRRDHPRIRGEHPPGGWCHPTRRGSSPHPRGAQRGKGPGLGRPGIIPASAGSTVIRGRSYAQTGDHPRIRGEHIVFRHGFIAYPGSSPHPRGAL